MLKTNLLSFGKYSTKLALKIFNEEDCFLKMFENDLSDKKDLESNEKALNSNLINFLPLSDINQISETYCFVDGGCGVAGAALTILEQFKNKPITIFYIKLNNTTQIAQVNEKITFQVLQEYSRSGLFKTMIIFDWNKLYDVSINSIPEDASIDMSDVTNLVIDRILFAINIYWKISNENFIEGNKINFDEPNYKIQTFFEAVNIGINNNNVLMYYDLKYNLDIQNMTYIKTYCVGIKNQKMTKSELLNINNIKKIAKEERAETILLSSDSNFVVGFVGTKIIQEQSAYLI